MGGRRSEERAETRATQATAKQTSRITRMAKRALFPGKGCCCCSVTNSNSSMPHSSGCEGHEDNWVQREQGRRQLHPPEPRRCSGRWTWCPAATARRPWLVVPSAAPSRQPGCRWRLRRCGAPWSGRGACSQTRTWRPRVTTEEPERSIPRTQHLASRTTADETLYNRSSGRRVRC